MRKFLCLRTRPGFAMVFVPAILPLMAAATPIRTTGSFSGPWAIVAQARNGGTEWEAALFSPDNLPAYMNPDGAPAWSFGSPHAFRFQYFPATGTTVWSIDFNRDGDFMDPHEAVTRISASLAGRSFRYLNLFLQGDNQNNVLVTATAQDFTINGVSFGSFVTDNSVLQVLFTDTRGYFENLDVHGSLIFSAGSSVDVRPRLWLRLGSLETYSEPADPSPVPEPSTLMLAGLGVTLLAIARRRRRPLS